jgi:type VI secretion system secreted protein VgrG
VLVAFLDGDVDQPVVVGALHNGRDTAPFPVGESTRRSGFRSQSIGGAGHNELSFEDLHGREEVYLHAQRNLREEVRRDRHANVHGSETLSVGGSASAHVGGTVQVVVDGHGRNDGQAMTVTAHGELSATSSKMLSITSPESIVLTCNIAAIQMTPKEIVLRVGDNLIRIGATAITLDAPTIWQNGGQLIDLHADRINLNSRGET